MQDKVTVVSILSPNYSGSTLLTYLLATHPSAGTIGERKKFFSKVIRPTGMGSVTCSCGVNFADCSFWQSIKCAVVDKLYPDLISVDFTKYQFYQNRFLNRFAREICLHCALRGKSNRLPYFPFKERFEQLSEANRVLIEAVLHLSQTQTFIDSSKSIEQAIYLSHIPSFNIKPILLIRDGRAQVYSTLKRHQNFSIDDACKIWVKRVTHLKKLLRKWNVEFYEIQYEQLCRDPTETLNNIMSFCNLDPGLGSLKFRQFEQHVMGNWEMRSSNTTQIRDKQEWRKKLGIEQLRVFERIAGKTNHYCGYT